MSKIQQQFDQFAAGLFKAGWGGGVRFNMQLGLLLILLFGIPRFFIVLAANTNGDYRWVSLIFVAMCLAPFILLTKEGRKHIGIKKPKNGIWLLYSLMAGAAFCAVTFLLGKWLYNDTISNWFVYIARSYPVSAEILAINRFSYFLIFGVLGMTFSPIGEELVYRGLIHNCFAVQLGENSASRIDSLAFAITHLAHFGIVFIAGTWQFLFLPALMWMLCMFIASRVFFIFKVKTDSLLGAILAHAGFNLAMTYFIVYHVLTN